MKIRCTLLAGDRQPIVETIEIDDSKLEHLSEDELVAAIEINVRTWADRLLRVEWETIDDETEKEG